MQNTPTARLHQMYGKNVNVIWKIFLWGLWLINMNILHLVTNTCKPTILFDKVNTQYVQINLYLRILKASKCAHVFFFFFFVFCFCFVLFCFFYVFTLWGRFLNIMSILQYELNFWRYEASKMDRDALDTLYIFWSCKNSLREGNVQSYVFSTQVTTFL